MDREDQTPKTGGWKFAVSRPIDSRIIRTHLQGSNYGVSRDFTACKLRPFFARSLAGRCGYRACKMIAKEFTKLFPDERLRHNSEEWAKRGKAVQHQQQT